MKLTMQRLKQSSHEAAKAAEDDSGRLLLAKIAGPARRDQGTADAENEILKEQAGKGLRLGDVMDQVCEVNGVKVLAGKGRGCRHEWPA